MGSQIVSHPGHTPGLIGKGAVELRLEGRIEGLLELWAGLIAQGDQMAAQYDRLGRGVFQGEAPRTGP